MRKIITFDPPVTIEENGTKIIVKSLGGNIRFVNENAEFQPDIMALKNYIKFEIPESQQAQIKQRMEAVTVQRVEIKDRITEEEPITKGSE